MDEDDVIEQLKKLEEQQTGLGEFKVEFPDVQKVEVTNLPEQKDPVINVEAPKVEIPKITVPKPEVHVNVDAPIVNVEQDYSELIKAIKENKIELDFSELSEELRDVVDAVQKVEKKTGGGYGGGARGPEKIFLKNTAGAAINPATSDNQTNGKQKTQISKPLTAFGEVLTGELTPIFQYSFEYTVSNTQLTTNTVANNGTVTQATGLAVLQSSTTANGTALLQSKREAKYRPGQGANFRFTAMYTTGIASCDQLAGLADETGSTAAFKNGYMIGYIGTTFGVHRFVNDSVVTVALANCDDPLDGTGATGMTIDVTKLNVFEIRFQYLGAGKIDFLVENDSTGQLEVFHTIDYTNANTVPSVYMPNFRATYWVDNGGTTNNMTLKTASCAYFVEGKTNLLMTHQPEFATGKKEKTSVTTEIAIFTIGVKTSYASKTNFIEILLLGLSASIEASAANNLGAIRLVKNATLGGTPTYADINATDSVVEIDVAGTTVTGGIDLLDELLAGKNDKVVTRLKDFQIILEAGDTLTVAGSSANSATIDAALIWKELF
jgi:hypothetical protein